jgi:hypothetical protein
MPKAAARNRADRCVTRPDPERPSQAFVWTATADEILAKVRFVPTNITQLVNNIAN